MTDQEILMLSREGSKESCRCTVREHARARQVTIRISPAGEVSVVVPRGFRRGLLPGILERKREWIERTVERLERQRGQAGTVAEALPEALELRAIGERRRVRREQRPGLRGVLVREEPGGLVLEGSVDHFPGCLAALRGWLGLQAGCHLVPWLRQLSHSEDLPFGRAAVRNQRTRWGSCSCRRTISLNQKLLFLPPPLVRYVLLHELCHTIHMHHSPRFWEFLGQREPQCRVLDRELRRQASLVPAWA